MSSATDELCRLLDERGVEWIDIPRGDVRRTCWKSSDEQEGYCYFDEDRFGVTNLMVSQLTPEQAIEATLGPGTCRNNAPTYLDFLCSECGFVHYHSDANDTKDGNGWGYCPNCGRRVVEVGE